MKIRIVAIEGEAETKGVDIEVPNLEMSVEEFIKVYMRPAIQGIFTRDKND